MRVTGVDACRGGWVAVSLDGTGPAAVRVHETLAGLLGPGGGAEAAVVTGIDMPLGLLAAGWREADLAARARLGPRRSSVFAIPPRAVWEQASYQAAGERCRALTGQASAFPAGALGRTLPGPAGPRQAAGPRPAKCTPHQRF